VAHGKGIPTEDTITLMVDWENLGPDGAPDGTTGHAVYTSSWAAPKVSTLSMTFP
jgi:D-galacturonate reductase